MVDSTPIPADLIERLRSAQRLVVLTGAGISSESGIPTFREAQIGLWSQYDPLELATPQAFAANPQLVWEWYQWRRRLVSGAEPNPAHRALVRLAQYVPTMTLVTQNVDGLHQQAGSGDVIELHGNIHRTICSAERTIIDTWPDSEEAPPRCPRCRALLRPDVVWFGESLPIRAVQAAADASRACDLFFSIGTSAVVQPAASFAYVARDNGAQVVEINAEPTPLTRHADYSLLGQAGALLPSLLEYLI